MSESEQMEYRVHGMTCEHCARSVHEEVADVPGVEHVDVNLASSRLTIAGERVSDEAVRGAVAEAGYSVLA